MSVELQEEQQTTTHPNADDPQTQGQDQDDTTDSSRKQAQPREPLLVRLRTGLSEIVWRPTLATAVVMAVGWCFLFLSNSWMQYLAGIVPVSAGLFLGRRLKSHATLHGLILGTSGFVMGLGVVAFYGMLASMGVVPMITQTLDPNQPPVTLAPADLLLFYIQFSLFAMIPFPALGTVIAHRNEQRRTETESLKAARGGELERPDTVRTIEDMQGLSLPKFGSYVVNVFRGRGFKLKDYRFEKDKHLDLKMDYNGNIYLMRLSVADKVRPGTVETLAQDMRQRNIKRGLVITSTEFTTEAQKSAKGRRNIVLIDGQTLFDIA